MGDIMWTVRLWRVWLTLGVRDVRLRFRRSVVGIGWIFLNLFVMSVGVGFVYSRLFGQNARGFVPFLALGLVAWGYLTASVVEGGNAFVASEGYIKQIGLPIYVYVFRLFVSISVVALVSLLAYFVVALSFGVRFGSGILWALPGMLLSGIVSLLLVTIFAHLNTRFRDATHVASMGLQAVFFVTPVLWPPEVLRDRGLPWVIDGNPLYHLIEVVRQPLLLSQPASPENYAAVGVLIAGLAVVAVAFLWHYQRRIVYFV